jgi:predicted nucleotidyltransferase
MAVHTCLGASGRCILLAMTPDDFFRKIEAHRHKLAGAGVRRLGVYGSVARGEARQDSDVDVLAEFDRTPDLFELAALRERLAEILGRPVDLATPQGLKPRLRDRILHEVRYAA